MQAVTTTPHAYPTNSIEVSLYRIDPAQHDAFWERHRSLAAKVRAQRGFCASLSLRGLEDPNQVCDYTVWDTHDDALRAGATLREDPLLTSLMKLVAKLEVFDHLRTHARIEFAAAASDVFEISAGLINEARQEQFLVAQPPLMRRLSQIEGFCNWHSARSRDTPRRFIDMIQWTTMEAAKTAETIIHGTQECANALAHFETSEVFAHFERVDTA